MMMMHTATEEMNDGTVFVTRYHGEVEYGDENKTVGSSEHRLTLPGVSGVGGKDGEEGIPMEDNGQRAQCVGGDSRPIAARGAPEGRKVLLQSDEDDTGDGQYHPRHGKSGSVVPTPPSLVGSPSKPIEWWMDTHVLADGDGRDQHHPHVIGQLKKLLGQAVDTKDHSRQLHLLLSSWEEQVMMVQQELMELTMRLHREKRKYSLRMMEKECDVKRYCVEIESLRGLVAARSASMHALHVLHAKAKKSTEETARRAMQQKEEAQEQLSQMEEELATARNEADKAKKSLEEYKRKYADSESLFTSIGIDPSNIAQHWGALCDEVQELHEKNDELCIDLEKSRREIESNERYYQVKIRDLMKEIEAFKSTGARWSGQAHPQDQQQHVNLGDLSAPSPRRPSRRLSIAHSNSGTSYSHHAPPESVTNSSMYNSDNDDILAAEVTNLRMRTRDLESQASAASDSVRLANTLEKETKSLKQENRQLREQMSLSRSEATEAKELAQRLQSELDAVHAQVAELASATHGHVGNSLEAISIDRVEGHGTLTPVEQYHVTEDESSRWEEIHSIGKDASSVHPTSGGAWKGEPMTPAFLGMSQAQRTDIHPSDTGSEIVHLLKEASESLWPGEDDHGTLPTRDVEDVFD